MEWYEPYQRATEGGVLALALEACSRKDCAHCLYQGKGIKCDQRLKLAVAEMLHRLTAVEEVRHGDA